MDDQKNGSLLQRPFFGRQHFGLRVLPVAVPRWTEATMVLWLRGRVPTPATSACLDALREAAATLRLPD